MIKSKKEQATAALQSSSNTEQAAPQSRGNME